jgi:hypothetical protein
VKLNIRKNSTVSSACSFSATGDVGVGGDGGGGGNGSNSVQFLFTCNLYRPYTDYNVSTNDEN